MMLHIQRYNHPLPRTAICFSNRDRTPRNMLLELKERVGRMVRQMPLAFYLGAGRRQAAEQEE